MIKKVLIISVSVSLCFYTLVGCQQPPRKYSVEVEGSEPINNPDDEGEEQETERGYSVQSTQQPPRDYPEDNRDDGNGAQNTMS